MSSSILLIEDEPGLVLTLADLFAAEGYEVETASDGPTGLAKTRGARFDVIVLDVMLPGMSGFDVCAELRRNGVNSPVLMLTARTLVMDKVQGLKLGADDYLTKPFDPDELLARIGALLRRAGPKSPPLLRYQFGDVDIDFTRSQVQRNGSTVAIAGKELQLLRYLIENADRVISRNELMTQVWNYHESVSSRTIDVHIAWLRQKLEPDPQSPRHVHTVRGVGYRFTP
jgi:DNA-binding response OmpR family regulator